MYMNMSVADNGRQNCDLQATHAILNALEMGTALIIKRYTDVLFILIVA